MNGLQEQKKSQKYAQDVNQKTGLNLWQLVLLLAIVMLVVTLLVLFQYWDCIVYNVNCPPCSNLTAY